eukprot:gene14584-6329_t
MPAARFRGEGYDQAKAVLTQLEGPMQPKVWKAPPRNLKSISQRDYAPAGVEWWILQMLDYAYVYQPTGCTGAAVGTCKLHVLYHGCGGGGTTDGIEHVGYLEYAEANNIIIVFPQSTWGLGNLGGCWDWWGITGKDFDTKDSLQLNVVMKMINDLPNILDDAHSVTATQRRAANSNGSTESGGSFASRNLTTASRPRPSKFSRMPNTPT